MQELFNAPPFLFNQNDSYFKKILDNMLEGVQILDFDWKYLYVNQAVTGYSHYSANEMIGYTIFEKYPGVESSDLFSVLKHCMQTRKPANLDTKFTFPNGHTNTFKLSIQPVPQGIFILSIDTTPLHKIEGELNTSHQKLLHYIDNSNLGWIEWNAQLKVIAASQRARDIIGINNFSDEGVNLLQVHPHDRYSVLRELKRFETGKHL